MIATPSLLHPSNSHLRQPVYAWPPSPFSCISSNFFLPTNHQPCDLQQPPETHIPRDLAHTNYTSVGMRSQTELPTGTTYGDFSIKGSNQDAKGPIQTLSDVICEKG